MMRGLLILLFGATAAAQSPLPSRIYFETKWNAHNAQVRVRPAGDSSAPWLMRTAFRRDSLTFEILPAQWDRDLSDPSKSWTVEARIPKAQLTEGREFRWAAIGAIIGTAAVITNAATCKDDHAEGPGCRMVIMFTPVAAGVGAALGRLIGGTLPVNEWQTVSVVKR